MKVIYEAHRGLATDDFAVEAEARAAVEAHGSGYIVKFICAHDHDRSCGMNVFEAGEWRGVNIHE